jgi:hypothetical protein
MQHRLIDRARRHLLTTALVVGAMFSTGATCGSSDAPTYDVTATVTGLVGSGLVLGDGDATVAVSASGPLTVTAALPDGTSYDVVVVAQPHDPAQVCTVTNGTGTIHGADAADIAIACATTPAALTVVTTTPADGATGVAQAVGPAITFSAAIDASTTGALTLTSAGGAVATTIGAIGATVTITPTQPLAPQTAYTLTIGTGLRGAGGEQLAAAVVTTFTTGGSTFAAAALVPGAMTDDVSNPRVAFDAAGNGVMLYTQSTVNHVNSEWSTSYAPATGWAAPVLVRAANTQQLSLAMNPAGAAVAVWFENDPTATYTILWSSRYTPGAGWSAAVMVETNTFGGVGDGRVAIDAAGDALVVWRQFGPQVNQSTIWANRWPAGGSWGAGTALPTPMYSSAPTVATDPNGNGFAMWTDDLGELVTARYDLTTGWGAPVRIDDSVPAGSLTGATSGQIVIDASGAATAVWMDGAGSRYDLKSARYTAAGGWTTPVLVETDNTSTASIIVAIGAAPQQLGVDATGAVTAVWTQRAGTWNSIYANRYTAAGGWGTPALLETANAGNASYPSVAVSASGAAVAVWKQFNGTDDQIWASRDSAAGWTPGAEIQRSTSSNVDNAVVAIDAAGRALAAWGEQSAAQKYEIWGSWSQ